MKQITNFIMLTSLCLLNLACDGESTTTPTINITEQVSTEKISFNAAAIEQQNPLTGFVIGITTNPDHDPILANFDQSRTIDLISELKPRFWRFANHNNDVYSFIEKGDFTQKYGTQLMFVMQDAVHVQFGYSITISPDCPNRSNCFKSFSDFKLAWERIHTAVMNEIVAKNYPIEYFEVFGEPINKGFGQVNSGTGITGIEPQQLLELYKSTHQIIRAIKPSAKIGGPGWISYSKVVLTEFLDYIVRENLSLDFLSWHEFGAPERIPTHASEARLLISQRPQLCKPNCPELHITEFNRDRDVNVPGAILGWLHYLEVAKVDWASSACWNIIKPNGKTGDICWSGVDGVLMTDNVTTTNIYWLYHKYALMNQGRLKMENSHTNTIAIADLDLKDKRLRALIGRYDHSHAKAHVTVAFRSLPMTSDLQVQLWRIPAGTELYKQLPLTQPMLIGSYNLKNNAGETELTIHDFNNGDVYYAEITPLSTP